MGEGAGGEWVGYIVKKKNHTHFRKVFFFSLLLPRTEQFLNIHIYIYPVEEVPRININHKNGKFIIKGNRQSESN